MYEALSFPRPRKLSDSPAITVTVNQIQTYFYNFAIAPTSGNAPFTITFSGYLSNLSGAVGNLTALNGETIELDQLVGGTWTPTGATATTAASGSNPGAFSGTFTITAAFTPGSYSFRAHYAGNTTKGMLGNASQGLGTQVGLATAQSGFGTVALVVAAPLAVLALIGMAKKKR